MFLCGTATCMSTMWHLPLPFFCLCALKPRPTCQPYRQRVMLAFLVPHATFVASLCCTTVLTSVPPSPLDARACCALQYHPQHVPHPQHMPRSFLIAGAIFVTFLYTTTIRCPHPSTHAIGCIPNTTPTFPAPAAAALHHARRRHPTICSKPSCVTQREYGAHHHPHTQHMLQLFPITHATFIPSPRAPTICSVDLPPPSNSPACTYLGRYRPTPTPPVCSTKAMAAPTRGAPCAAYADGVDPERDDAPAKSAHAHGRSCCAPSPSAWQLRLPFGNADPPGF
ncbi:hypothetical protein B0H13DRAFT_1908992 [Mycena leptocephala]|nr:hypothetical protein B0H13DRAFT_1908992 [Mycena leptocephala]